MTTFGTRRLCRGIVLDSPAKGSTGSTTLGGWTEDSTDSGLDPTMSEDCIAVKSGRKLEDGVKVTIAALTVLGLDVVVNGGGEATTESM
jgi:hypothetical protein